MNFDVFDAKMREYEQLLDICIPPGIYFAVRLDGRSFTRLTKEHCPFERPFDKRFRDYMVGTVKHLMDCGFNIIYGYTQSDEISLLFSLRENGFARKTRKLNSILAGEASAVFSTLLGRPAAFDCRAIPLPSIETVRDYFLWRQEDANRNTLNAHCYWTLRKEGMSAGDAAERLKGKSLSWKREFLFNHAVCYDGVPSWQKHGIGIWWESYKKDGMDPITGKIATTIRRRLHDEYELPIREDYASFIEGLLTDD